MLETGHSFVSLYPMPHPHLLTSIGPTDVPNLPPNAAALYLDIVHTGSRPSETIAYARAGIEVIPYTNINHYIPSSHTSTNAQLSMSDVALTCDGRHVKWLKPEHPLIYLTDIRKHSVIAAWERWFASFVAAGGQAWAIFEDTADNPFTYAYPAPPCNAAHTGVVTPEEWTAAAKVMEGQMQSYTHKPVIFNGLATGYNKRMPTADALLDGPVAGGEAEACAPYQTTQWVNQLTIEIHAFLRHKYFVCHGNDTSDGSTAQAIAYRQYHFATMMLDVDVTRTVYESYFSVGASNLRIEPEVEVVMIHPARAPITKPTDLLKPGGAYGRVYRTCYVAGRSIGECAAVVNPTSSVVPFPFPLRRFHHTMLLRGSGIRDGGTVSALGPPPAATLQPYTGEVAFP